MNVINIKNIHKPADSDSREHDIKLAAFAASGDETAQKRFVMHLLPQVRRTMSYMIRDPHMAEDLTQNTLIRLLDNAGSYRGESSLLFWAARVSSRVALNEIKKISRQKRLYKKMPFINIEQPVTDRAEMNFAFKQLLAYTMTKIRKKYQTVLILKYVEGYTIAEIASITQAPENTVKERLKTAKAKIRKAIEKEPELAGRITGGKV